MTAQLGVGKTRKGQVVDDQGEHVRDKRKINGPEELDDNWWAAVLADEPLLEEHTVQENPTVVLDKGHLHHEKSKGEWDYIKSLFTNDEIITLQVVSYNRGGVLVEGTEIHGFVPASHLIDLPVNITEDEREYYFQSYLEREISLKVIECDPDKERVVFSERAALAGAGQRINLLSSLAEGDVISGVVTNITDFGVFIDLGGLEGLIHVSELSWGRVHHPSMIVKLEQEVEAMVIDVLENQGRVALSLKRLDKNPWDNLANQISPGDVLDAVISSLVKYGAFARLEDGIEGLIHISTIKIPPGFSRIEDFLFEGQAVKVGVVSIDPQKRRLGLMLES